MVCNTIPVARGVVQPLVTTANLVGITVPNFMLGVSLIFVLSVKLNLLPSTGWAPWSDGIGVHLQHMIMPVLTLSTPTTSAPSRSSTGRNTQVSCNTSVHPRGAGQGTGGVTAHRIADLGRENEFAPRLPCGLARFVAGARITTTCCGARMSASCCRSAARRASVSFRAARWLAASCAIVRGRQEATQKRNVAKTDDYTYKLSTAARLTKLWYGSCRGDLPPRAAHVAPGEIALCLGAAPTRHSSPNHRRDATVLTLMKRWPRSRSHSAATRLQRLDAPSAPRGTVVPLPPITKRIDQQSESRCRLATAPVIEVVAWRRRAPVGSNAGPSRPAAI